MRSEIVLGLPDYEVSEIQWIQGEVRIAARYSGPRLCPHCGGERLRNKGTYQRQVRHENWGLRHGVLELRACKWQCKSCGRYFCERFPGILPCQRSSEAYQEMIFRDHLDGINRSRLGRREGIGAATVERYFRHGLQRQFGEWHSARCPPVLGIDEHFFTRRSGYATTLCDLRNHKIYDVVLSRSELALEAYFQHRRRYTAARRRSSSYTRGIRSSSAACRPPLQDSSNRVTLPGSGLIGGPIPGIIYLVPTDKCVSQKRILEKRERVVASA